MEIVDYGNPAYEPEYECNFCGKPMHRDKQYCSGSCFEGDMR